jgi:hypothetical protein
MREKAIELANRALQTPSLLNDLSEDVFFKFVMGISRYDISLAMQVEQLKPFTNSNNKVLFWEAVGILVPLEDYR